MSEENKVHSFAQVNLPRKDEQGRSYLSYSQISLFNRDPKEYHNRYIIGQKFEGNEYTDFGSKVGEALEHNDFTEFDEGEQSILKQVTRLDEFEKRVTLEYKGFYVMGFIDTNTSDYSCIIDYKTGGKGKEYQYAEHSYDQLTVYALALRQMHGVTPTNVQVQFIRRKGNAYRGQPLKVANELPITIPIEMSLGRLKRVYWDILRTAKNIEKLYEQQ